MNLYERAEREIESIETDYSLSDDEKRQAIRDVISEYREMDQYDENEQ